MEPESIWHLCCRISFAKLCKLSAGFCLDRVLCVGMNFGQDMVWRNFSCSNTNQIVFFPKWVFHQMDCRSIADTNLCNLWISQVLREKTTNLTTYTFVAYKLLWLLHILQLKWDFSPQIVVWQIQVLQWQDRIINSTIKFILRKIYFRWIIPWMYFQWISISLPKKKKKAYKYRFLSLR